MKSANPLLREVRNFVNGETLGDRRKIDPTVRPRLAENSVLDIDRELLVACEGHEFFERLIIGRLGGTQKARSPTYPPTVQP